MDDCQSRRTSRWNKIRGIPILLFILLFAAAVAGYTLQKPAKVQAQSTSCDGKTDAVLVVDASGSMYGYIPQVRAAGTAFVNAFLPNTTTRRVGVIAVHRNMPGMNPSPDGKLSPSDTIVHSQLSNNITSLNSSINKIESHPTDGLPGTCISCGIRLARQMLQNGGAANKTIVVLSDGRANQEIYGNSVVGALGEVWDEAAKAKAEGVKFYVIGYGDSGSAPNVGKIAGPAPGKYVFQANPIDWAKEFADAARGICPLKTVIGGRVTTLLPGQTPSKSLTNHWSTAAGVCGTQYSTYTPYANLFVKSYRHDTGASGQGTFNLCNTFGPYWNTGSVDPARRTISLPNIPPGYECVSTVWYRLNLSTNAWQAISTTPGCSMTGDFQIGPTTFQNYHHVNFFIRKVGPTVTPSKTVTPTVKPTVTPVADVCIPPVNTVGTRLPNVTVLSEKILTFQNKYCSPASSCRPWPNMNVQVLDKFPSQGFTDIRTSGGLKVGKSRLGMMVVQNVSSKDIALEFQLQCRKDMQNGSKCTLLNYPEYVRHIGRIDLSKGYSLANSNQVLKPGEIRKYQESQMCAPYQLDLDMPFGYGTGVDAVVPSVQGIETERDNPMLTIDRQTLINKMTQFVEGLFNGEQ